MIFVPKSSPMNLIGMFHSRSLIKPCRIHKIVLVVFRITKAMAGKKISREKTTLLHPYADSERCRQVNTETDSVRSILITTLNEFDDHCCEMLYRLISGFSWVLLCLPFRTLSRYQLNRQGLLLVYRLFSNYAEGCWLDRARSACIRSQLSWSSPANPWCVLRLAE